MQSSQPQGPNPDYDFIMNSGQKPKESWLPDLGLPKIVTLALAGAVALIVLIIVASLIFGGNKAGSSSISTVLGKAQEVSRASSVAFQATTDTNLKSLTTTVSTVLNSQEAELSAYVSSTGQKTDSKVLSSFQNTATDSAFAAASQNNTLTQTYKSYAASALKSYQTSLNQEYKSASSQKLKTLLAADYDSVQTLLSSPDFK